MAGKKRETPLDKVLQHLDNARADLQVLSLDLNNRQRLTRRIDALEIDLKKATYTAGATEKVMIIDRLSGEMTTVDGYKAALAQWRAKDEAGYKAFASQFAEFLSNFREDSMFVRTFGKTGEKLLPPSLEG